jgi:hypothetical protein
MIHFGCAAIGILPKSQYAALLMTPCIAKLTLDSLSGCGARSFMPLGGESLR